ncbi:MAG: VIT1/CCC1 transporter family protein [Elusimicrobia bacterium]|nr:VIT1/CCC1 transporter family protein [Elusimicrobiota bacterium]
MTERPGHAHEDGPLEHSHHPDAIRARLSDGPRRSYLKDFVFGAIDGAVTTFAVVAGVQGAGLSDRVVLILGIANLAADGFSMAVGNFLGCRSELQQIERARRMEERHVERDPAGEREEIRQIYAVKGFDGDILDRIVTHITGTKKLWVDTMLREELGLDIAPRNPVRAGGSTFLAFVGVGLIPLLAFIARYLWPDLADNAFAWSASLTAAAFFWVGALKGRIVDQSWWVSGLETLLVGSLAATVAYLAGFFLRGLA